MTKSRKSAAQYEAGTLAAYAGMGILLIALGLITLLSVIGSLQGVFFAQVREIMQGIGGGLCFGISVLMIWAGVLVAFSSRRSMPKRGILLITLLYLAVLAMLNLLSHVGQESLMNYLVRHNNESVPPVADAAGYWSMIDAAFGLCSRSGAFGGALGMLLAWPLWTFLGTVLGTVALGLICLVCVLVFSRFDVMRVYELARGTMSEHGQRREQKRAQQERELMMEEQRRQAEEEDRRLLSPAFLRRRRKQEAQEAPAMQQPAAPSPYPPYGSMLQQSPPVQAAYPGYASPQPVRQPELYDEIVMPAERQQLPWRKGDKKNRRSDAQEPYQTRMSFTPREMGVEQEEDNAAALPASKRKAIERIEAIRKRKADLSEQIEEDERARRQQAAPDYAAAIGARNAAFASGGAEPLESDTMDYAPVAGNATSGAAFAGSGDSPKPQNGALNPPTYAPVMGTAASSAASAGTGYSSQLQNGMPRSNPSAYASPSADTPAPGVSFDSDESSAQPQNAMPTFAPIIAGAPDGEGQPASPTATRGGAYAQATQPADRASAYRRPEGAQAPAIPSEPAPEKRPYLYPSIDLLNVRPQRAAADTRAADAEDATKLEKTLESFSIPARVHRVTHGPAVTRFELGLVSSGVNVKRIMGIADNIALDMAANGGVRIEVPIPGTNLFGVEIPNKEIQSVTLAEVLQSPEMMAAKSPLAVALGRDIAGRAVICDLAKMPHLLIAGQTGSGKSVCINAIINSILFRSSPDEVRMIMIDPKVVELQCYNVVPHLLIPVVSDPHKAAGALQWAVAEMLDRYHKMQSKNVREVSAYNAKVDESEKLPRIVIVIDELADLMLACKKEVEESIIRIAQLARAAGIHMVVATQRPTVDVITGLIKANIPSRIAFAVSSSIDSRTILDQNGAEKLLGRGDMFYFPTGASSPMRVQGCFLSDAETERVVGYIGQNSHVAFDANVIEAMESDDDSAGPLNDADEDNGVDDRLAEAIEMVISDGQASISMLQRRMKIGYARAGRLIDDMAARGIVSKSVGSKPREVLISREEYEKIKDTLF